MGFPLGDWVLDHPNVRHNLALSGFSGTLATLPKALRTLPPPDPARLRSLLGRLHGVPGERVFLTHGATEANALVLLHLFREATRAGRTLPKIYHPVPEYPPLGDAAAAIGFGPAASPTDADAVVLSNPRNPEGTAVPSDELAALADDRRPMVVDQTFREFTEMPSVLRQKLPRVWVTGSFTKIYGADELRLGYAIPAEEGTEAFGRLHGLLLDRIPKHSVSAGLAVMRDRARLLDEARGRFRANERYLRHQVDDLPELAAPVWFQRGPRGFDDEAFAHRLLKRSILVCPGWYFGEPAGLRLALTMKTFPADLDAYLARWAAEAR